MGSKKRRTLEATHLAWLCLILSILISLFVPWMGLDHWNESVIYEMIIAEWILLTLAIFFHRRHAIQIGIGKLSRQALIFWILLVISFSISFITTYRPIFLDSIKGSVGKSMMAVLEHL